jgi:hypothetical protein
MLDSAATLSKLVAAQTAHETSTRKLAPLRQTRPFIADNKARSTQSPDMHLFYWIFFRSPSTRRRHRVEHFFHVENTFKTQADHVQGLREPFS